MPATGDRMGQSGHDLEVAVENLFAYSTFDTDSNVHTSAGEVDVLAETDDVHVAVECKAYKRSSTARVTRDHISNIAKKAELIGAPNAVLVTTKMPSEGMREFARETGVKVRSWGECEDLEQTLRAAPDPGTRTRHLVREFALVEGGASRTRRELRELKRVLFSPNGDWSSVGRVVRGVARENWAWLALGVLGIVLVLGLLVALVPAVQEALRLAFYTAVAGVVAWGMWKSGFWDAVEEA